MSGALHYELTHEHLRSAALREAFAPLVARAREIEARNAALAEQLAANRARRTGKPARHGARARAAMDEASSEIDRLAAALPAQVAAIEGDEWLLRSVLDAERWTLEMERSVFGAGPAEDVALVEPILALRAENVAALETLVARAAAGSAPA